MFTGLCPRLCMAERFAERVELPGRTQRFLVSISRRHFTKHDALLKAQEPFRLPVNLRQPLKNIVHNAVHYSTSQTHIVIRTTERKSQAVIEVADQGPGLAAEHRQKIFERLSSGHLAPGPRAGMVWGSPLRIGLSSAKADGSNWTANWARAAYSASCSPRRRSIHMGA